MNAPIGSPTVAVTGAAGYIGSRVVQAMQEHHPEWSIVAIDNFYEGTIRQIGDVQIEHVDVRNRDRLEPALDGVDVVHHLAAISGVEDCNDNADLAYDVNVQGTNNVAWFCRKTGAAMVFPFSMAVVGDPERFPITADHPRDPLNWYGRTKYLSEEAIEVFAADAFPAHLLMKSNLYGHHTAGGSRVSKPTVINFFVDRALSGDTLTVYEPGTQSRNFVHVKDVARVYVRSTERLLESQAAGETGTNTFEIASDEAMSVLEVAELVSTYAEELIGEDVPIEVVDNPREDETQVESFDVDVSKASDQLDWQPERTVEDSIERLLRAQGD